VFQVDERVASVEATTLFHILIQLCHIVYVLADEVRLLAVARRLHSLSLKVDLDL